MATLCLDDGFAHSWHSLNQLHLECFSNSLEGVTTYAAHLLAAFPSLWLLHDCICYFIVLMSSLLFYNVENCNFFKEKPLNE